MLPVQIAAPICGSSAPAVAQPEARPQVELILLPSDGLERARPRISLSSFIVHPGPKLEALMRSAAFRATEHKYDI